MGLEAHIECTVDGHAEPVHALLESRELILRGKTARRRFALADMKQLRLSAEGLCFTVAGESVSLRLGVAEAAKWLGRIQTPPPTLASKLGVGSGQPAAVFGPVDDDAELAGALAGARTDHLGNAAVLVAAVFSLEELMQALQVHAGMSCMAVWVVHAKGGKAAAFGDGAIREVLRARGYKDNKTSAVSARLTATRYLRP